MNLWKDLGEKDALHVGIPDIKGELGFMNCCWWIVIFRTLF